MGRRVIPEVWGVGEICDHLRVSRVTVHTWRKEPDFPKPVYTLRAGSFWLASDVRAFRTKQMRQRRKRQKF